MSDFKPIYNFKGVIAKPGDVIFDEQKGQFYRYGAINNTEEINSMTEKNSGLYAFLFGSQGVYDWTNAQGNIVVWSTALILFVIFVTAGASVIKIDLIKIKNYFKTIIIATILVLSVLTILFVFSLIIKNLLNDDYDGLSAKEWADDYYDLADCVEDASNYYEELSSEEISVAVKSCL